MAIFGGLITTTEFSQFSTYPVPTGDKLADQESAIESASRWIEQHCGREFHATTSSARYFDAIDGRVVWIDDATSVTAVDADFGMDGTYATAVTNYQLLPVGGVSRLLGTVPYNEIRATGWGIPFPLTRFRLGAVRVTGVWGWTAVPTPIKRACMILTLDLVRDAQANYGGLVATDVGIIGSRIPKHVLDLCAPFRRMDRNVVGIA